MRFIEYSARRMCALRVRAKDVVFAVCAFAFPISDVFGVDRFSDATLQGGLFVRHYEADLDYDGEIITTDFDQFAVSIYDHYSDTFAGGIDLGWTFANQDDQPLTAGIDLSGVFLGLGIDLRYGMDQMVGLLVSARYTFNDIDGDNNDQKAELTWHELSGALMASIPIAGVVRFNGGIMGLLIDGNQRARGEVDETRSFEQDSAKGFVGEVDWNVGKDGFIGLRAMTGTKEGFELRFLQLFY